MKYAKAGLYLLLVIMITFVMISPSAAEGFSYENEATVLNDLGLYKGTSTTSFDPDLGASLNRETGVVMLLRIFGLEDDALAMTDAEANTILLKFTDAASISSWAKKPLAYAVKNGLVLGNSNGTVASQGNLSGKAYCTMILRQLGYTPNYDLAPNELVDAGGLTATQAAKFKSKPLKKDDLVGISYGTLSAKDIKGEPVLVKLIANKVVDASAAFDSGLTVSEAARVASEAVSAYEAAPIVTLAQITVAEKLGTVSSNLVALIKDAGTKAKLEARIKVQIEKVATAKKKLQEPTPAMATLTLTIEPSPEVYTHSSSGNSHSTPSMSGTVSITGTGKYGSLLTADPSALTNAGTPAYQWKRGGVAISGATASTYTLVAADIGAVIAVTATADGVAGTGSITSEQTAVIVKADGPAAPAAPTEASKTANSITLTANVLYQFSKDNGVTWQDSETFTGLTASTAYTFVARVKETATTNTSAASGGISITTNALPAIGGTLAITGAGKYGSLLTADPSDLTNAGTPTYQWKRGGVAISGATASTYTLTAADIGAVIAVTATADGVAGTGSITSEQTAVIVKADGPAAPSPPTEASKTDTSITLVANALNQFSIDNGVTWQDSETFTDLEASTPCTLVARVRATATTNASAASGGTTITTAAPYVVISSVEVTCPSPAIGQSGADATVNAAAEYVHTSTVWSGRTGVTYVDNETPVAVITLTAKAGKKFTGLPPAGIKVFDGTATLIGTVTYEGGQGVQSVDTSIVFTVTYPQL